MSINLHLVCGKYANFPLCQTPSAVTIKATQHSNGREKTKMEIAAGYLAYVKTFMDADEFEAHRSDLLEFLDEFPNAQWEAW